MGDQSRTVTRVVVMFFAVSAFAVLPPGCGDNRDGRAEGGGNGGLPPSAKEPAAASTTAPASRATIDLPAMKWEHRILAIFAAEETDLRLEDQRKALGPGVQRLRDRDIRVVEIVGDDPLRETLDVPLGGFHVLLIGKDGGVKLRRGSVVPLDDITGLIDTMPMRQREAAERKR